MKEIWFVRHCESQANAGLSTFSPESIALTEKGYEQSKYIPSIFTKAPELIVTSPYLRTRQTAEPTVEKFPEAKTEEWPVQEFTYLSLKKYANTTMKFRRPFVDQYWERSKADYCDDEGCESFAAFISRVETLIKRITEALEKAIVIFTHGQFMKAVLWILLNNFPIINDTSMKRFYAFLSAVFVPNASVFNLTVREALPKYNFSGLMTAHLPDNLITF